MRLLQESHLAHIYQNRVGLLPQQMDLQHMREGNPNLSASKSNNMSKYTYTVVPFSASIANNQSASAVASELQSLIESYANNDWEFVNLYQLETFKAGGAGCFGFGATPPTTLATEFVIFRK